ncbi:MAG: DMT family transporter [Thermodesulfobacteriota bacterium]
MKKGVWLVILSGILYGTIAPGAQILINRGFAPLGISFFRSFFVTVLLLPVVLKNKRFLPAGKQLPFFIIYGLNGAVLEIMMFASLGLGVPVALVALLLYSQPVWTIFLGKIFLNENITKRKIIAAIVGFCGIAVLVKSWEVSSVESIFGIILAIGAGFLLSIWIILGKKSANLNQHYITTTFSWSLFGAVWLILFYIMGSILFPSNETFKFSFELIPESWFYLIVFASLSGLLPHLLFYRGVITVSGSVAGIILLIEPATATMLADIIFSQSIGFELIIGGTLILFSNYFVLRYD